MTHDTFYVLHPQGKWRIRLGPTNYSYKKNSLGGEGEVTICSQILHVSQPIAIFFLEVPPLLLEAKVMSQPSALQQICTCNIHST